MQIADQANIEYFYRLVYNCLRGACFSSGNFGALLSQLWFWIVIIGYLLALLGLGVIIYAMIQLFDLRKREEEFYGTLLVAPDAAGGINPRWTHIESLAAGESMSDWRSAIIEADIMLDDMLTTQGYTGAGIGEKLKEVERSDFATLDDAWEAHKVRNQIAHEGSAFDLSETLARRTLARYEAVFREFDAI